MKPIRFYLTYLQYFVITCIIAISYFSTSFIKEINIGTLVITALITSVIVNLILFLIYRKTSEYKYMKGLVITTIKSIKNKGASLQKKKTKVYTDKEESKDNINNDEKND